MMRHTSLLLFLAALMISTNVGIIVRTWYDPAFGNRNWPITLGLMVATVVLIGLLFQNLCSVGRK